MHIKAVHETKPKRASKRLSNFTPVIKASKKSKNVQTPRMDPVAISDLFLDTNGSFLLADDSLSRSDIILEEALNNKSNYEDEHIEETNRVDVELSELYSCDKCKYEAEKPGELKTHMSKVHSVDIICFQCDKCQFESTHLAFLRRHISMKHKEFKEYASDSVQENCELKSKMQSSQGINGKYFHCDKCPFETPQLSSLRKDVGINHTEVIEGIHETKLQKVEVLTKFSKSNNDITKTQTF